MLERARVNGVELEYELNGWGPPVLLIHGSHICRSFLVLLAQRSLTERYTLIRYHRRGYLGSSPATGSVSIKDQAADAVALLNHLHLDEAHVVGHSYGGSIALQLAVDAPSHVHSLVLLEAALTCVPHWTSVRELNSLATERYRRGDWEAAVDPFLPSPADRALLARRVPGALEQAIRDLDTYFRVEVPAHEAWSFTAAEGQQIKQPVLWIEAGDSRPLYQECRDRVRAWMPQTETVVLEGATHSLHIEQPARAASLLAQFLDAHPMRPARAATRHRAGRHYNATTDLLDGNLEQGRADKVAIRTEERAWTYAEVAASANRVGNALRDLGLEAENRVLMAVHDSPEFAATFFGVIKLGAVPVPVNTNLSAGEYASLLDDSRAKVAVVSEPVADVMRTARRRSSYPRHLLVIGGAGPGELSFQEITQAADARLAPANTTREDVGFWLYTSGATGEPSGVIHLQHAMRSAFEAYARPLLGMTESDATFSVSKLHFAYGLGNSLYFPFAAGASSVLVDGPALPRLIFDVVRRFRPSIYFGVPTSYAQLLGASASSWKAADFSSVRVCVSSSERLPGSVLRRWKNQTGLEILDGIGSTESCHIFISNRPGDVRPDCGGTLVDGYRARVVDAEERVVPHGHPGLLRVSGESTCAGYWRQPGLTKQRLRGEWLSTGDICVQDATGHFAYQGRADDMLKVGGMWVNPEEVEAVLAEDERVVECAVVGVLDSNELVKPEAFVVLANGTAGPDLEGCLEQHVRQRLGGNKTPRAFHFVAALPGTVAGSIDRAQLRNSARRG